MHSRAGKYTYACTPSLANRTGTGAKAQAKADLLGDLHSAPVSRLALRAQGVEHRHVNLLRRIVERCDGQRIVVQAVVDQHATLAQPTALPVHVTPQRLDVVGGNLSLIVPARARLMFECYVHK